MKVLVIVDAQNDFIDGSLGTSEAKAAVPKMVKAIKEFPANTLVLLTKDTHDANYMNTQEGKNLPVEHCNVATKGWSINDEISAAVKNGKFYHWSEPDIINGRILKSTFGSERLVKVLNKMNKLDEINLMGFCTDICVISNALMLKSCFPETKINVYADCCAGSTSENHEAAIKVMKACQINIIEEESDNETAN